MSGLQRIQEIQDDFTEIKWGKYEDVLGEHKTVKTVFISQDINNTGARRFTTMEMKDLEEYLDSDQNLYEIIHKDHPSKMYIDFDCKYNDIRHWAEEMTDEAVKKDIVSIVSGFIEDFQEEYQSLTPEAKDWVVHISDASNKLKFSFHFVVDIRLSKYIESKAFHEKFKKFLDERYNEDQEYRNIHKYIDRGVYTRNRNFRLVGQSKFGQDRPLQIYQGSKNHKDHFITYFNQADIPDVNVPKSWIKTVENKENGLNKLRSVLPKERVYDEDEELQFLIKNTQHKTVEYSDWIMWVWACLGAGISPEKIHDFSYKGSPEKYSEEATDKIIQQYVSEKSNLGFDTLKAWSSDVGKDLDREVEKKQPILPINKEDHITWIDLLKKYHGKVFNSEQEFCNTACGDINQVISLVQGSDTIFTVYANDEDQFKLTKKLCTLDVCWLNPEGKVCGISLNKYMTGKPLLFPLYNKIVFKPRNHGLRKNERNTFTGFQASECCNIVLEEVPEGCSAEDDGGNTLFYLLRHIKEVLSNNNEQYYAYIMSWLAQIIKTPWKPTDIFLLFQGDQGAGKTMIAEFLVKYIFGRHLSLSTNGIKPLVQRFNGAVKSKLFVCCNELTNIDGSQGSFHSAFDTMKNLITDRLIQVEMKGFEHIQIDNFCNFMGTTNHQFTAKLEKTDRRYACFETNGEYIGNYEYFDRLGKSLNQTTGDMFYSYLLNYPVADMVDLRKIPNTELRQSMINNSRSSVEHFIDDLLDDFIDIKKVPALPGCSAGDSWIEDKKISKGDLYAVFLNWCTQNGEKTYSNNVFGRMIPKDSIKDSGNSRINGKVTRWIQFK